MAYLLITFFALLLLGIPVAAVMGISSLVYLLSIHQNLLTIPQRMFAGGFLILLQRLSVIFQEGWRW